MACETLEEAGLRCVDADVTKLYLRLRPGQCGRAHEGVRLAELVDEIQNAFTRCGNTGPERNAHRGARRYAHAIPEREHRIKNGAHRVGQTPSVHHGNGRLNVAPTAEETRSTSFELRLAQRLAFNDGVMSCPDFRIGGRAPPPRREDRAHFRHVLGLHEELRECRMCHIGGGGRQHELGIRCDLQVAHSVACIHDRYAANLRVVLRRNDHLQDRGGRRVAANEFRSIFGEGHLVAVGLDAAGLIAAGPHGAAFGVMHKEIAA